MIVYGFGNSECLSLWHTATKRHFPMDTTRNWKQFLCVSVWCLISGAFVSLTFATINIYHYQIIKKKLFVWLVCTWARSQWSKVLQFLWAWVFVLWKTTISGIMQIKSLLCNLWRWMFSWFLEKRNGIKRHPLVMLGGWIVDNCIVWVLSCQMYLYVFFLSKKLSDKHQ